MRGNTVTASLRSVMTRTRPLWQYDYGQVLVFADVTLPPSYEVHFANEPHGTATTAIGDEHGVEIPDIYLTTGKPIYAWLYLHNTDSDGETEYSVMIPVERRATVSDQPPTPVQQDAITQAIAALDTAMETTAYDVADANMAKEAAENARDTILGMSAEATTLPAGSNATANYYNGVMTFGIPRGEKGEDGGISDVRLNGNSVVTDGVANLPLATSSAIGMVRIGSGLSRNTQTNAISISTASFSEVKAGNNSQAISTVMQHAATFYGLAKAAGDTTQSASSNGVGNYTDAAKDAIQMMFGIADLIAPHETSTASQAYSEGDCFIYNGKLYRATDAIAEGDTITPDTNCEQTTIMAEIARE